MRPRRHDDGICLPRGHALLANNLQQLVAGQVRQFVECLHTMLAQGNQLLRFQARPAASSSDTPISFDPLADWADRLTDRVAVCGYRKRI